MTDVVLVTGATGKTGRRVVRQLADAGVPVRAASRSGSPRFDWSDPGSWPQALVGVSAVYLVHPDMGSPEAEQSIVAFAEQAVVAGVRRAVVLTGTQGGGPQGEAMLRVERAVQDAFPEWTVLRPRWFFQNFTEDFLLPPVQAGEFRLPTGEGRDAFVDAEDIAAVAVAALTLPEHSGQVYDVTGPELLSFADVADRISTATGRPVAHQALSQEEFVAEQREQGVPQEWVDLSAGMYTVIREGGLDWRSDDVERVLGRPSRSFEAFAADTAAGDTWRADASAGDLPSHS